MIVRGPRPSDTYTQIHTDALADGTLSFKARGILAFLLTLPPGAEISAEKLAKSGTDGERAVKSGLKELETGGYLVRITGEDTTSHLEVTDTPGVGASTPPIEHPLAPHVGIREDAQPTGFPEHLRWLCENHPWLSPAAVRTAHREIELQDLPLAVTKYEIRMVELNKKPSSGEWLRWLIEDEQKMRLADREAARERGERKSWWETA